MIIAVSFVGLLTNKTSQSTKAKASDVAEEIYIKNSGFEEWNLTTSNPLTGQTVPSPMNWGNSFNWAAGSRLDKSLDVHGGTAAVMLIAGKGFRSTAELEYFLPDGTTKPGTYVLSVYQKTPLVSPFGVNGYISIQMRDYTKYPYYFQLGQTKLVNSKEWLKIETSPILITNTGPQIHYDIILHLDSESDPVIFDDVHFERIPSATTPTVLPTAAIPSITKTPVPTITVSIVPTNILTITPLPTNSITLPSPTLTKAPSPTVLPNADVSPPVLKIISTCTECSRSADGEIDIDASAKDSSAISKIDIWLDNRSKKLLSCASTPVCRHQQILSTLELGQHNIIIDVYDDAPASNNSSETVRFEVIP